MAPSNIVVAELEVLVSNLRSEIQGVHQSGISADRNVFDPIRRSEESRQRLFDTPLLMSYVRELQTALVQLVTKMAIAM